MQEPQARTPTRRTNTEVHIRKLRYVIKRAKGDTAKRRAKRWRHRNLVP